MSARTPSAIESQTRTDVAPALYRANTLQRFWRLPTAPPPAAWEPAATALLRSLPGPHQPSPSDWDGLMEYILGEGQFGPDRYRLSATKRLYYRLRPWLPRPLTAVLRRQYHSAQDTAGFPLGWPVEERYARFMYAAAEGVRQEAGDGPSEARRSGLADTPTPDLRSRLWPDGADFAFVLTHDVERPAGRDFVRQVAALDERFGFRSSFNFVPEAYVADLPLLLELRERGFEVGVHGLVHDGRLFTSAALFQERAWRINAYLHLWQAAGFRSPLTHRNPAWMQALDIDYDLSCFDVDPYEPMPGGVMSIWPFFCGRYVELPYTLVQDHTLFVVLGEQTPRLWLDKVAFLARWGGMALVNVHPDYLRNAAHLAIYEAFLQHMAAHRSALGYWHALPRAVAQWWRGRELVPCASTASRQGVNGKSGLAFHH